MLKYFLNGKKYEALVLRWLLIHQRLKLMVIVFYQSIKRRKQCFLSLALILNQRNQLNDYNFFLMFHVCFSFIRIKIPSFAFSVNFFYRKCRFANSDISKARQGIGILHSLFFQFLLIDPSRITTSSIMNCFLPLII
jgi:hypothetical protein